MVFVFVFSGRKKMKVVMSTTWGGLLRVLLDRDSKIVRTWFSEK